MIAPSHRSEWDRLRAEHAAARSELVRAIDALEERMHDPLGVKASLRRHPWMYAGGAAALGALAVSLLRPKETGEAPAPPRAAAEQGPSSAILDTVLRVAEPWLARLAAEYLGPPPPAETPTTPAGDES